MGPDNDPNYDGDYPAIATNHQNGYLITWQGDDNFSPNDGETEIYIQMYGDSTLSTHKISDSDIAILPNPTNGFLHIYSNGINTSLIQLFNVSGQQIENIDFSNQMIDLRQLNKGLYILKVTTVENRHKVFKIIKS
jgi:hypothetical protein